LRKEIIKRKNHIMKTTQILFALALGLAITIFKSPALSYAAKTISPFSKVVTRPPTSIEHKGSVREEGDGGRCEKNESAGQGEESTLIEEDLLFPLIMLLFAEILLWLALEEVH
jgi:hypothetical protein